MAPSCRHSKNKIFDGSRTVVGRLPELTASIEWTVNAAAGGAEEYLSFLYEITQHDAARLDLAVAEAASAWTADPGLKEWLICHDMRKRARELCACRDERRDRSQLDAICDRAESFSCQLERFAVVALGIYNLRSWSAPDRFTLAKWQLLLSTTDHGRQITVPYHAFPRDLFDRCAAPESLASWLDEHSVVRDHARV